MTYHEQAVVFECQGYALIGIVTIPRALSTSYGVLVIVGGPQYRGGSHRQFVLLARFLAGLGIPCMRFDYRGMGDASGEQRDFEDIDDDIRAAIDCYYAKLPGLERIVLWALCDAASAACFYAARDDRVAGLVLLNPWVRTAAGEARTQLKNYYAGRLMQPAFWKKLLGGGVSVGRSVQEIVRAVRKSFVAGPRADSHGGHSQTSLPARMAAGLTEAQLPMLFILSGRDSVAHEFDDVVRASEVWTALLERATVRRLAEANHTFARHEWREAVAEETARWVAALDAR